MASVIPLNIQPDSDSGDTDLLDRLLADLSPEQRSRVLELVMRLNIERDDPLFLIAVATNQLTVLVHDAPNNWSALFSAFLERLDAWTTRNLTTLEKLAAESAAVEQLSNRCALLARNTDELQTVLKGLITALESSPVEAPGWEASLKTVQRELTMVITSIQVSEAMVPPIASAVARSPIAHGAASRAANSSRSLFKYVVLALMGLNISIGFWQLVVQRQHFNQLNQRLEWLLQKHNRRDCKDGILPADSPLCSAE